MVASEMEIPQATPKGLCCGRCHAASAAVVRFAWGSSRMALVEPTMGLGGVEWGGVVVVVGHWEPVSTHDTKNAEKEALRWGC